jgi:hypothetical protein
MMAGISTKAARGCGLAMFGLLAPAALPATAAAQTATRFSLEAAPRVGYSTNPFLLTGDTDAAFIELGLTARYSLLSELEETSLTARVSGTEYLGRYGLSTAAGGALTHRRQLSPRADLVAAVEVDSSLLGERELLFAGDPLDPTDPGGAPGPIVEPLPGEILDPDIALVGGRQRRTVTRASYGLNLRPAEADFVSLGADVTRSDYSGRVLGSDYFSYGANGAYTRAVSPNVSAGGRLALQRVSYDGQAGDSKIIQPQALVTATVGTAWRLEAAAGLSIVSSRTGFVRQDSTDWSASLRACHNVVRSTACANFARDASASGLGGVRTRTSLGATYSYRLTELSSVNAGVSYARYSGISDALRGGEFWSANAGYQRRISERLALNASAAFRGLSDERSNETDVSAQIGISYRYGQAR